MILLEIFGLIFSVIGALYMSRSTEKYPLTIKFAFISFTISNIFMIHLAIAEEMAPMLFQYIFLYLTGVYGVMAFSLNSREKLILIGFITVSFLSLSLHVLFVEGFKWNFVPIEIFAASLVIFGNFLLRSASSEKRIFSFVLFIFADIIYIQLMVERELYVSTLMFAFFFITSAVGIKNTLPQILNKCSVETEDLANSESANNKRKINA